MRLKISFSATTTTVAPATAPAIPGKENDYLDNYSAAGPNSPKSIMHLICYRRV